MNIKKKTFTNIADMSVRSKIEKFQKFARPGECVIGSGMCGYHNVKLTRSVTKKKMSNINKDGTISWTMREVTILRCPATQPACSGDKISAIAPLLVGDMEANKKPRISVSDDVDQSISQHKLPEGQQTTPVDSSTDRLQR